MYRLFYIETIRGNKYLQIRTISDLAEADQYEVYFLTNAVGEIILDNRGVYHNA